MNLKPYGIIVTAGSLAALYFEGCGSPDNDVICIENAGVTCDRDAEGDDNPDACCSGDQYNLRCEQVENDRYECVSTRNDQCLVPSNFSSGGGRCRGDGISGGAEVPFCCDGYRCIQDGNQCQPIGMNQCSRDSDCTNNRSLGYGWRCQYELNTCVYACDVTRGGDVSCAQVRNGRNFMAAENGNACCRPGYDCKGKNTADGECSRPLNPAPGYNGCSRSTNCPYGYACMNGRNGGECRWQCNNGGDYTCGGNCCRQWETCRNNRCETPKPDSRGNCPYGYAIRFRGNSRFCEWNCPVDQTCGGQCCGASNTCRRTGEFSVSCR